MPCPYWRCSVDSDGVCTDEERRKYPRVNVRVPVELSVEDSDTLIRGATSDLSLTGCYIESIFPLPIGTNLELKLQVDARF